MALFPQGLSAIDARCTPGERRVLQQLRRCLEDDHLVWHDIAIGPRARQPDFAVLSPRWGLLLLEVKDWKRTSLVGGTPDAVELDTAQGRKTVAHPLRQVRDVAMELVSAMQRWCTARGRSRASCSSPTAGASRWPGCAART
jgi:hypothetical protein